jgi:hypothetical protein
MLAKGNPMKLPIIVISLFALSQQLRADVDIQPSDFSGDFTVTAGGETADRIWSALIKKKATATLEWWHRNYNRGDGEDVCALKLEIESTTCTISKSEEDREKAYLEFGYKDKGLCGSADLLPEIRIKRDPNTARATLTLAEAELLTERLDRVRHPHPRCVLRVR